MSGPFGSSQWMYNAGGGFYGFEISNSLRFNDGDSAYLSRTPNASNRRTWTWSGWVKRSTIATSNQNCFFGAWADDNNRFKMNFYQDKIEVVHVSGGTSYNFKITQLFRDVSAWYHIVLAVDTTQGTDTNRYKIYINGEQVTAFDNVSYPAQNFDGAVNSAIEHTHGESDGSANYLDGYLAEVNFIDGTALTPASFGELKNDIWIPKNTSGLTFGSQGFRLQFKQSGTGTASSSTIGADTSGNNNHWTSNNLASTDVVLDSPTNNFATLNPLDTQNTPTISEGNLKLVQSSSYGIASGTIAIASGKYYWEVACPSVSGSGENESFGISKIPAKALGSTYLGINTNSYALMFDNAGPDIIFQYNNSGTDSGVNASDGDIFMLALDSDTGKLWFGRNGTWFDSGNPANGSNEKYTATVGSDGVYYPVVSNLSNDAVVFNFGQDSSFAGNKTAQGNADANGIGDFYYAPPSGFLALCTANLPDPVETIDPAQGGSPQDYFNTVLYTGNGADNHSISGVGFQPDWVWMKSRNNVRSHALVDSVRGRGSILYSDLINAQETPAASNNDLVSFDTDGFTVGTPERAGSTNTNNDTIVAWNWKAGTAFSNDASATGIGSIDSAGSVNTDVGFSIINYVGSGGNGTYAHGLGVTPEMVMVKDRTDTANWAVYHKAVGTGKYLELNQTDAVTTDSVQFPSVTSTVIGVGVQGDGSITNTNTDNYIAYCFASVDGYSKFGSYIGNSNADGPFVYTGFRPAFILYKKTASENWHMKDTKIAPFNVMRQVIDPNRNGAEVADANTDLDFLSNGFKMRASHATQNENGSTYIYMAFAEQPFKYANGR